MVGDKPLTGRHGHSACEYKNNLIIFGGEREFNPSLNFRKCLNDVHAYHINTNEWKNMRSSSLSSLSITQRRCHAATIYNRFMYVYGGITNEGTYAKDVWAFNLSEFTRCDLCILFK